MELDDKTTQIKRIQTENEKKEQNHAMRTAMLAAAEQQIEDINKECTIKDDTVKDAMERVTTLQVSP